MFFLDLKKIKIIGTILTLFFAISISAFAASPVTPSEIPAFDSTVSTPQTINQIFLSFAVNNMVKFAPVLILVALVTFLAGVVRFISAGDNEEKRASGKNVMVYGIVVLFFMITLWGIVGLLTQSFFKSDPSTPNYLPNLL